MLELELFSAAGTRLPDVFGSLGCQERLSDIDTLLGVEGAYWSAPGCNSLSRKTIKAVIPGPPTIILELTL